MDIASFLGANDILHIIGVKFFLIGFLIIGALFIWRRFPLWLFLSMTGIFAAGAYLVLADDLQLMFWGLQGDEITIAAMYETFAHGSFFSDFAYANLPPFYPPLFFWFFALVGRVFGWHGVMIAKFASATSIAVFPLFGYLIQKWAFGKLHPADNGIPRRIAWFLAPLISFIVIDWDAFILKPYECIAAFCTVVWSTSLFYRIHTKQWSAKIFLIYAVTGGIIFMTYYLWLVFAAIAVAFAMLWVKKEEQWRMYRNLLLTAVFALVTASPYLGPLIASYARLGSENWQTILMTMKGISYYAPMFQLISWDGFILLAGCVALFVLRQHLYGRLLMLLFLSAYIWQWMGLATVFFFHTPIQEFKGFDFFNRIVIAFALAWAIERLWEYFKEKYPSVTHWRPSLALLGLFFLSTQMIFGFFIDDPVVQQRRVYSKQLTTPSAGLIRFLQEDYRSKGELPLTVHAGIGELHAFVPLNMYLYLNQHNTHPAAHFSLRKGELAWAFGAQSPQIFLDRIAAMAYGPVERFIFFKEQGKDAFDVRVFVDKFPHGAETESLLVPKSYFSNTGFLKKFENERYVVFDVQ